MMGVTAIVQARLASTRLPGKVLLDLEGRTVLERVLERVRASRLVGSALVATTVLEEDGEIAEFCRRGGIDFYRGSSEDVLDRFYQAALARGAEHVVRITADCPLLDPRVIDAVVERHLREGADYTSNICPPTFPDGEDVEALTFRTLERAWREATLRSDREHVTTYIRNNPGLFRTAGVSHPEDLSSKRWTLDNAEDYEFLRGVYRSLVRDKPLFGMEDVLAFLEKNPRAEAVNRHIRRNEGYLKSLRQDSESAKP
jgi:spore coat polysaccharide biosynthesis protein SpsF